MTQSLLGLACLDWQVPDFSTVSQRQKILSVTTGAQPTTTGLHLLVDSVVAWAIGTSEQDGLYTNSEGDARRRLF